MHEWRRDAFAALRAARAAATGEPLWTDFAAYCDLRERGLRGEALQRLEVFMHSIVNAGFEERRRFLRWLLPLSDFEFDDGFLLRPKPLDHGVVVPTLHEWVERAPTDPQPLIWLGSEKDLRQALAVNPGHPEAAARLAALLLHDAHYAMHELPWALLGNPVEVLSQVVEAGTLLKHAPAGLMYATLRDAQAASERLLRSYSDYLRSADRQAGQTFQGWTNAGGRPSWTDLISVPRWRFIETR